MIMENEQEQGEELLGKGLDQQQPAKAEGQAENEVSNYEALYVNTEKDDDGAGDFGSATRPPGPESSGSGEDASVELPSRAQNDELPTVDPGSDGDGSSDGDREEDSDDEEVRK
jgi:hypothetical protein